MEEECPVGAPVALPAVSDETVSDEWRPWAVVTFSDTVATAALTLTW